MARRLPIAPPNPEQTSLFALKSPCRSPSGPVCPSDFRSEQKIEEALMSKYLTFLSAVVALMAGVIVAAHAQPVHHQDLCFSYEYGFLPC